MPLNPLQHLSGDKKISEQLWWGKKLLRLSGVILGAFRGVSDHEEGFI